MAGRRRRSAPRQAWPAARTASARPRTTYPHRHRPPARPGRPGRAGRRGHRPARRARRGAERVRAEPRLRRAVGAVQEPDRRWSLADMQRLARRFRLTPLALALATRLRESGYMSWAGYPAGCDEWSGHVAALPPRGGGFASPAEKAPDAAGHRLGQERARQGGRCAGGRRRLAARRGPPPGLQAGGEAGAQQNLRRLLDAARGEAERRRCFDDGVASCHCRFHGHAAEVLPAGSVPRSRRGAIMPGPMLAHRRAPRA